MQRLEMAWNRKKRLGLLAAVLLWAVPLILTSCGTTAPSDTAGTADASDGFGFDAGKDTKDVKDSGNGKTDVESADETTGDVGDVTATTDDDAGSDDADTSSDTDANVNNCTAEPGAPGCPCQENGTCDLPLCLPTAQGAQCAKPCIDTCPDGFKCVGVSGPGGDLVTVCVDKSPHLCDPCVNSNQCGAVGLQGAACVDAGKDGHFCGTACKADGDCPGGYTCASVTSVEGNTVSQCQPPAGGSCTCSASAVADQLSTSCFAEAKDDTGAVVGQCKGVRACGPDGLTACNASIQTETCNGQDDDCDGQVDEGTCDDKNPCTMDTCDGKAQTCGHSNAPGSCDADGNACTIGDSCVDGKCVIGSLKSCDDNNPCTTDACDPLVGCTKQNDDGSPCSDGSSCTVGDVCTGGACVSGTAKTCPAATLCASFACDAASGQCQQIAKTDGTGCTDGTACTGPDKCQGGECIGAWIGDCDDTNPCTSDSCDATTGCNHIANQAPCDDGNACTDYDTCAAKACKGTPILPSVDCDDGNPCTTDTCNKAAATVLLRCLHANNILNCSDGNSCTQGDKCAGGSCAPGATIICGCQQNSDCVDDGNLCNGTLYCDANNTCKVNPATIVNCGAGGNTLCSQNSCDPATGNCSYVNVADGKACDADGSVCTANDACVAGVCVAGTSQPCDDGNPCTNDSCDPMQGCVKAANVDPCDLDGNACSADYCANKVCNAAPKNACDDGKYCTVDSCDPTTGACNNDPTPQNGMVCDDGSNCTKNDYCGNGICIAGNALNCDDSNPCTTDACDPASTCVHTSQPDGTACGAAGNWCVAVKCVKKPVCGDGFLDVGEDCDLGSQNGAVGSDCAIDCTFSSAQVPLKGELIISEAMFTSNYWATDTTNGKIEDEWVELYNNTPNKLLKLTGLYFKDSSSKAGAMLPSDPNGSVGADWVLKPGQYALIAVGSPTIGNAVVDWIYGSSYAFNNTSGDVACISIDKNCLSPIAKLTFNGGAMAGHSSTLKATKYATAFATGSATVGSGSWCDASTPISGQTSDYGTPKAADSKCQ